MNHYGIVATLSAVIISANSKCHFSRKICNIPILQQFHLLYHLTSITEKFSTIFCQSNSGSTAEKNGDTSLFFRFFDGIGQTWL